MPDLYGKLNKEIQIYNYEGVETDTAKVTVDNKTQDISVDVKRVPNELTLTTINGNTYTYDGSEPASFDIRTQVTDKVEEGNNLPVTSDAVKGYVDSKAGALEYVGGEGNFTNIDGGVTVKGRLNVDDGIYSPVTSDDPNFVPNNKSVDDKITASEQKLIDERIGAFTRTADKLFTDVTGGMTIKGHLNVDGGITSASAPTADTDVVNKSFTDGTYLRMESSSASETHPSVYAVVPTGEGSTAIDNQLQLVATPNVEQATIALRDTNGTIKVGEAVDDEDAVNLIYADDHYVPKVTTGNKYQAYIIDNKNQQTTMDIAQSANAWTLPRRGANGVLQVGTPSSNGDATTKKYVDDADANKLDLTGGTITGSLAIQGDLTVTGTTTTEKAETLAVKDSVIVTNADGAELGATLSGIAIRKDGENTYGVMYDPSSDSVKLGLGTLDADNKFTFNESGTDGKPIATRDDSSNLADGDLVRWDSTSKSLVDSGKKVDDFVPKVTKGGGTWAYIVDGNDNQDVLAIDDGASEWSLARRGANGTLQVGTATEDTHAMPKKQIEDGFVAKVTTGGVNQAYTVDTNGQQAMMGINENISAWTLVRRYTGGRARVGTAVEDNDAVNKKQVEDNFIPKSTFTGAWQVIVTGENSDTITTRTMSGDPSGNKIVNFDSKGRLQTNNPDGSAPTEESDRYAVNVGYANANYVAKVTTKNIAYTTDNDGNAITTHISFNPTAWDLVTYDGKACLRTSNPTGDDGRQCVNKQYADDNYVAKIEPISQTTTAYVVSGDGTPSGMRIDGIAQPNSLAYRSTGGVVRVGTPVGDADATTKAYVDNLNAITITAGA